MKLGSNLAHPRAHPRESWQIEVLVPYDEQRYETYAKIIFRFFKIIRYNKIPILSICAFFDEKFKFSPILMKFFFG